VSFARLVPFSAILLVGGAACAAPASGALDSAPIRSDTSDTSDTGPTTADQPANPLFPRASCSAQGQSSEGDSEAYDFDDRENEIQRIYTDHADASANFAYASAWQARLLTLREFDAGADGSVNARDAYQYNGVLVDVWSEDTDGDGVYDAVYQYAYDDADRVTGVTRDDGDDGSIDGAYRYTLDAAGHVTELVFDEGNDGSVDTRWTQVIVINDAGETVYDQVMDVGDDGIADRLLTYVLDRQSRFTYEASDSEADGVVNWLATWSYDESELLSLYNYAAYLPDGAVDYAVQTSYEYDPWGREVQSEARSSSSALPFVWVWSWTCGA
jgi:hypothetical protein